MSKTILIVDDSVTSRMSIRLALEHAGFTIIEAENGEDGIAQIESARPDAVVCDVNMPVKGGLEMLEFLHGKYGKSMPPILMLTTKTAHTMMMHAKKFGARGWLVKPFKPAQLVKVMTKLAEAA